MQYKSITKVDIAKGNNTSTTSSTVSYITGTNADENFTVSNIIEYCQSFTKGTFDDFVLDVSALHAIADVTSVKAFVCNDDELNVSLNDIRFTTTVGAAEIGDVSSFEVANSTGLTSNITFTGVAVTEEAVADDNVVVYVIITTK